MFKVALFSFLLLLTTRPAWSASYPTVPLVNAWSSNGQNTTMPVSVIDQADATALYQEFLRHTEIPFGYPVDGCTVRASAMAAIAQRRGITMAKTYAEGLLQARSANPLYPFVKWSWHVAPSVFVRTPPPNSRVELMIFDPAVLPTGRPLTVDQWKSAMLTTNPADRGSFPPKIDKVYSGTRFQIMPTWDEPLKLAPLPYDDEANAAQMRTFKSYELDPSSIPVMMERPSDSAN